MTARWLRSLVVVVVIVVVVAGSGRKTIMEM